MKHGQITSDFTTACESNWQTAIVTKSCFFIYFSKEIGKKKSSHDCFIIDLWPQCNNRALQQQCWYINIQNYFITTSFGIKERPDKSSRLIKS